MDVDTCKAIAAAVLGDKNKVEFLKTTTSNRFIDSFTVAGGRLIDQTVWNDLAERRGPERHPSD